MCCPVLPLNLKDIPICCLRASPYTMAYIEQMNSNDIIVQKRYDTLGGEAVCMCTHFMKRSSRFGTRYSRGTKVWSHAERMGKLLMDWQISTRWPSTLSYLHVYTCTCTCTCNYVYVHNHMKQLRVWDWTTQTTYPRHHFTPHAV